MSHVLVRATGGTVSLPDPATIMIDRADGGQLVLHPPRRVWDRTALTRDELVAWHLLIAATARAMLETLPQLEGGCLNYWDAGNWALQRGGGSTRGQDRARVARAAPAPLRPQPALGRSILDVGRVSVLPHACRPPHRGRRARRR